ncbi:MAG: hypothetical protein GF408_00190 [Candidatus Omnitrophica bacterium]|nr:hypothetical protein [Candidatus Omnitrophota bacterium]
MPKIAIFVSFFVLMSSAGGSVAFPQQSASYSTSPERWTEDLSDKVDRSIKILNVVKEELRNMEKTEAGAAADPSEQSLADRLKGKLSAVIRMWNKVSSTASEGKASPGDAGARSAETEKTVSDMRDKLDKTMELIEVIKTELDEVDKEASE